MTVSILLSLALAAGAPEPVVWTKMADPDPTYVAPKAKPARPRTGAAASGNPKDLDGAMINLLSAAVEAERKMEQDYEREVRRIEQLVERAERAGVSDQPSDDSSDEPPQR